MNIDQIREVLKDRVAVFTERANEHPSEFQRSYLNGKAQGTREAMSLLEPQVLDGEVGPCPKCGGSFGSRTKDGRWRCHGLSSYGVLASECCGHVYDREGSEHG